MSENMLLIAGGVLAYLMGRFHPQFGSGNGFITQMSERGGAGMPGYKYYQGTWYQSRIIVMMLDIVKAWAAVMLASVFAGESLNDTQLVNYQIVVGALAVLGHVFPVFTGFKGGKGVASLVGVIIALYSLYIFLLVLGWFALVFIITRYVSLASITASILFAILAIFIFHEQNTYLIILAAIIAVFIPITHHKNIKRMLNGEESKLTFRKRQKSPE